MRFILSFGLIHSNYFIFETSKRWVSSSLSLLSSSLSRSNVFTTVVGGVSHLHSHSLLRAFRKKNNAETQNKMCLKQCCLKYPFRLMQSSQCVIRCSSSTLELTSGFETYIVLHRDRYFIWRVWMESHGWESHRIASHRNRPSIARPDWTDFMNWNYLLVSSSIGLAPSQPPNCQLPTPQSIWYPSMCHYDAVYNHLC